MADEESQVEEETLWWASEGFADSDLPSMSIDEPLEWPDSLPWEEFSGATADGTQLAPPAEPADLVFPVDAAPEVPAEPDQEWQAGGYDPDATMAATPLAGLGGGSPARPPPADEPPVQPLPESIWSFDGVTERDDRVADLSTLAAPLVYADSDGRGRGRWPRHLDIRRGNVAVVALISAVSLVLLGMFLSVRSRNDLPTDATASPPRTDQIATGNTRNPQTSTSLATSTTVAGAINIAELVPAADAVAADTDGGGTTGTVGRTAVATTAPARSSAAPAPTGGGGSTATTQPAPQSTATTAAPEPVPDTTTPTSPPPPPVDDTTATTRPRTSTPTFTMPSFPDVSVPNTGSSIPRPSIPNIGDF